MDQSTKMEGPKRSLNEEETTEADRKKSKPDISLIIDDIAYIIERELTLYYKWHTLSDEELKKPFPGIGGTLGDYYNLDDCWNSVYRKDGNAMWSPKLVNGVEIKDIKSFLRSIFNDEIGVAIYLPEDIDKYKVISPGYWLIIPTHHYRFFHNIDLNDGSKCKYSLIDHTSPDNDENHHENVIYTLSTKSKEDIVSLAHVLYGIYNSYINRKVYMRVNVIWRDDGDDDDDYYKELNIDITKDIPSTANIALEALRNKLRSLA